MSKSISSESKIEKSQQLDTLGVKACTEDGYVSPMALKGNDGDDDGWLYYFCLMYNRE